MNNPAVIILDNASSRKGKFKRFVLEDNIGEAIHLHVDNMRLDFTIKEFLEFSQMIRDSLCELDFLKGYSVKNFDALLFKECACFLHKLVKIEEEKIELSKLKYIIHMGNKRNLNLMKLVSIFDSPAYKYLNGDKKDFLNYEQVNYAGINNEKQLLAILESVKINNYPYKNNHLVLFNGQNIIRDGQHRAAVLAHLHGLDYKVKFMRFYFNDYSHFIKINKSNFIAALKWFVKKVYRNFKK